ncbi:sugar ABC transporter substrate-binding protein [Nocardioides sp. NPDC101246]|uniref:sugar ABC transporter substrate-binding protein n=1 Tax=Nocardioides sp. NPDC101246 TaxID=3364336 RepID=UPI003810B930
MALAVSSALLASCGSDTGSASPSAKASASSEVDAALDKAYAGLSGDLADLTSVTPKEGVNFYVISCGQSLASCASPTQAMMDAAEAAGWSAHMADGKLSPDGFAAAIRQAVAGGADVIVPVGFDCQTAQAAFKEATDAGIVVVGGGGPDTCDPKLWKSERLWLDGYSAQQQWGAFGQYGADWAYGQTGGDLKAVTITATTNPWGQWITDGFNDEAGKLGGTIVANVDVTDPESADGSFVQKVTTALLAHPEATTLQVPIGSYLTGGLYQAIVSSGREDLTIVVSGQAGPETTDLIRSGSQNGITLGAVTQAQAWGAWGSIDTAVRVLAGEDPVFIGEEIQAVDSDHNLPESGAYDGSQDWKSAFLKAWGKA